MEQNKKSILISGASIAGLTAAYWMTNKGFQVTVVEKDNQPRVGGSPIDVRGLAIEVAKEMGILTQLEEKQTQTEKISFVNASGKTIAGLNFVSLNDKGDIELQRDDLIKTLYAVAKDKVEYIFNDSISTIEEDKDGVNVTFRKSAPKRFDIIIGADGLHSKVRKLVFGNETEFIKYLGMYVAVVEVSKEVGVKNQGVLYNSPGKLACIYRYNDKADLFFTFRSPQLTYNYNDSVNQKDMLLDAFKNEGWEVPKLLEEVRSANRLYFDSVSQIKMNSWSKGRVVLIGDAAHCAAFLSGMGSTLAMVGAKFLADELGASEGDYVSAFSKYEKKLRPIVTPIQAAVPRSAKLFVPSTKSGLNFRNRILKIYSTFIHIKSIFQKRK